MTRRNLVLALGAAAAASLAGCRRRRREEELPDLTIGGEDDALAYALGALGDRYGEEFQSVDGADVAVSRNERSDIVDYMLVLAPAADAGKPFGCDVAARLSDGRLASPAYDDYTQYVFKEQMEGPYREAVAAVEGLAGYGVVLGEPYMGDRVWRPEELEEYLANGYTHPRVDVLLMMPRDGGPDSWAATVGECLAAVWDLGRRMYVHAGIEGTNPFTGFGTLYTLDISQTSPRTRDAEPPGTASIRKRMRGPCATALPEDGYEPWDGTVGPGDPGYADLLEVTWHPGHPVMG